MATLKKKSADGAAVPAQQNKDPLFYLEGAWEAARKYEDRVLMAECNKETGWSCGIPRTSAGEEQRSGYPDLRLVLEDQSIVYLDPKLFARGSKTSTLRTFYYER